MGHQDQISPGKRNCFKSPRPTYLGNSLGHCLVDGGRIALKTEKLVPTMFDVADSSRVYAAWQQIGELIAIINGAARIEAGALHEVTLAGVAY